MRRPLSHSTFDNVFIYFLIGTHTDEVNVHEHVPYTPSIHSTVSSILKRFIYFRSTRFPLCAIKNKLCVYMRI